MATELPFEYQQRWALVGKLLFPGGMTTEQQQALFQLEQKDRDLEDFLHALYENIGASGGSKDFQAFWTAVPDATIESPVLTKLLNGTFTKGSVYYTPGYVVSDGFHLECDFLDAPSDFYFILATSGPPIFGSGTSDPDTMRALYGAAWYNFTNTAYAVKDTSGTVVDFQSLGTLGAGRHMIVDYTGGVLTVELSGDAGSSLSSNAITLPSTVWPAFWSQTASLGADAAITNLANLSF